MVTSNQPTPVRKDTVPVCAVCDVPFPSGKWDGRVGWCERCKWEKGYVGPQRANKCLTCLNNISLAGQKPVCAFMMYQMVDGTWRDRYGQATHTIYGNGGMTKHTQDVKPSTRKKPTFVCEGYENTQGRTREQVKLEDPEHFFSKARFR